jgi:uncharacterized protein
MRFELANLEGGKGAFSHTYAAGDLVLDDDRLVLVEPPTVSGEIRQRNGRVKVTGRVKTRVQVECDRCLQLIELPINSQFMLEYVTAEAYQAQQAVELTQDDLDLSIFDGEAIDIDELVKEELLLALPDHLLCSENCNGICAKCGAIKNLAECGCDTHEIDPRWAGLKDLVNSK